MPGAPHAAADSRDGYDPRFFDRMAAVEERHFWFVARRRIVAPVVRRAVAGRTSGYRVLEVGCGTGSMLGLLQRECAGGRVFGMDLYLEALAFARGRPQTARAALLQGDLAHGPFSRPFDVVCLFDVLEHLPDDERVLGDLHRLTAPGGALFLTVPAWPTLWSYFDVAAHHQRRYRPRGLGGKLAAAGFAVEYLTPMMAGYFPLMYLRRRWADLSARLGRATPAHERAVGDLEPPPLVNGLLSLLTRGEPALTGRGIRLPTGTSLLAVARKPAETPETPEIK
ncbi:MAG TPA: class I SAM-dependent methyltransferase [Thermoanaerobaculia bacterium]